MTSYELFHSLVKMRLCGIHHNHVLKKSGAAKGHSEVI